MDEGIDISEEAVSFLYQSVSDIQSTIRAIDTKLGIVLIILTLPFANMGKICDKIFPYFLATKLSFPYVCAIILVGAFAVIWILAFGAALRGIIGIDYPVKHVKLGSVTSSGAFYAGGLFTRRFIDSFINRRKLVSSKSAEDLLAALPKDLTSIGRELLCEQMKVAYIRDLKMTRQNWAFRLTVPQRCIKM